MPIHWKEIAWNGISFSAPENWEVANIGKGYLMLEEDALPVLELKWNRVKGAFSHKKHIRRLAALHGKNLLKKTIETPLPPDWKQALDKYEATGFNWQGRNVKGKGAVLFCPDCRTATLIQFYIQNNSKTDHICRDVLTTFQDHRQGDTVAWSIYDIRALIPATYTLSHYRFEAGHFLLAFIAKSQTVTLRRWGPASILLSGKNLLRFAEAMNQIPKTTPPPQITDANGQIEGIVFPPSNRWLPFSNPLKSKTSFQMFRLWHLKNKNRILGVSIKDKKPVDPQHFQQLCANYGSL